FVNRNQELAGIKKSNYLNRYAIQIIVEGDPEQLLLEHEQYKAFKKSTDLYFKHPENPSIPVQAHYHIVANKSKEEIYAVNMDGTAHHRQNKGFQVPKKQADELRKLGVKIAEDNILESRQIELNESFRDNSFTFFIVIED
ncbi:hypothetical protein, partial [Flavobacterium filum]|uniref:hypothetical protein n=1 Tax=Flavobacterium filum TaxID=370974 RepID=UPI0023F22873